MKAFWLFLTSRPILCKKNSVIVTFIYKLMLLMFFTLLLKQFLHWVEAFLWLPFWSLEVAVNYSRTFAARIPKLANPTVKVPQKGINVLITISVIFLNSLFVMSLLMNWGVGGHLLHSYFWFKTDWLWINKFAILQSTHWAAKLLSF